MAQQHIETLGGWGHDIYPKLSWFRQERVSEARIMVVGCGALGNEVLKNLVLFGVHHLVIVDFDQIEVSNLSRSILFSLADTSRNKVDVAAERLRGINPEVEVLPICGDIAYDVGLGLLRKMDVVIGCVDSRWARYCINRLCMRAGIPWVDGGIDGLEGTVRVFAPGQNCYACNLGTEGLKELTSRMPCSGIIRKNEAAGRAPTTPVIASIIGAVQVQEAMKIVNSEKLIDKSEELTSLCGKMFYYEGQHLTTKLVDFKAYDDDCPVHEYWEPIIASPLSTQSTAREVLEYLNSQLSASARELDERTLNSQLLLLNDCFVDYIEDRQSGQQIPMMCAGHHVADRIAQDKQLGRKTDSDYYQHEIWTIDKQFPWPQLTLKQLGIPDWDLLHVRTEYGDYYVELTESKI